MIYDLAPPANFQLNVSGEKIVNASCANRRIEIRTFERVIYALPSLTPSGKSCTATETCNNELEQLSAIPEIRYGDRT